MDKGIEALTPVCVPKRIVRNWAASVMRHCDYCSHYEDTVLNDDGSAICASCCDSEHSGNMQCALEEALQRNSELIAALEQAQQEYQNIEQKLISAAVYIETLESEPRKTNLKLLNEIAGLKRKCEELEAASIKPVNMPDAYAIRPGHPINEDERSVMIPKDGGNWFSRLDIEHALRVAGVKFEGGE